MRLALLFALFALPLLEIALLIKAGQVLGFWGVLLLVIGTAMLGMTVIRRHGFTMARRMSEAIERGHQPGGAVLEGALIVLAGSLLVAPGLITDTLGLLLLIPPLRTALAKWGAGLLFPSMSPEEVREPPPGDGTIIEGEFERLDERTADPGRNAGRRSGHSTNH